jgi:hypothetical protein
MVSKRRASAVVAAIATATALAAFPIAAQAHDTPAGFYYGADGSGPGPDGSNVEYTFPNCGGAYGLYVGNVDQGGSWTYNHQSYSNAANLNSYEGYGIGSENYYSLGGPGDDGATTPTAAQDYGEDQGDQALSNLENFYDQSGTDQPLDYIVLYADIEASSTGSNGWNGNKALDRDVFNGFFDVTAGVDVTIDGYPVPVYTGMYGTANFINGELSGTIAHTIEWTAQTSISSYSNTGDCASGWNSGSRTADFYLGDGQGSACAINYQYISGSQDYDQVDADRLESGIDDGSCD